MKAWVLYLEDVRYGVIMLTLYLILFLPSNYEYKNLQYLFKQTHILKDLFLKKTIEKDSNRKEFW